MAEEKKKSLYEKEKKLVERASQYKKDLEGLLESAQAIQSSANVAMEIGERDTAQALLDENPYKHHMKFLKAGYTDTFKKLEEAIDLTKFDDDVLKQALFSYRPKEIKEKEKYSGLAKEHAKLKGMVDVFESYQSKSLSQEEKGNLGGKMFTVIAPSIMKKYQDTPFIEPLLSIIGGRVMKGGKVGFDPSYGIEGLRVSKYAKAVGEKQEEFLGKVKDVKSYIKETLNPEDAVDFYKTIIGLSEAKK